MIKILHVPKPQNMLWSILWHHSGEPSWRKRCYILYIICVPKHKLCLVDTLLTEKQQRLLKDLKGHTGLTDDELSKEITESHFNKIADHIENYEPFAQALQLKGWRITEIKTDPNLSYIMKTRAVLRQWRQDNPFEATYLNLVLVALELSEGTLATKICEFCKGELSPDHGYCM